jgi:hypothetical protein
MDRYMQRSAICQLVLNIINPPNNPPSGERPGVATPVSSSSLASGRHELSREPTAVFFCFVLSFSRSKSALGVYARGALPRRGPPRGWLLW